MDTLANNKVLSENNIGNVNSNNTDILGIGKAIESYFSWKKFKITITQQNIEPLHHLIRKDILTTQPKTKDFIDKIFTLYEKSDPKISMAALRVIEYMDDALLEAIKIPIKATKKDHIKLLRLNSLTDMQFSGGSHNSLIGYGGGQIVDKPNKVMLEILELIKLTEC